MSHQRAVWPAVVVASIALAGVAQPGLDALYRWAADAFVRPATAAALVTAIACLAGVAGLVVLPGLTEVLYRVGTGLLRRRHGE